MALTAWPAGADVPAVSLTQTLPAFWVEAICRRSDNRCNDYLMEAHQRVYSGAGSFPDPYCPRAKTVAGEMADFLYAARWFQQMTDKPGQVTVDQVIAAMAANIIPCRPTPENNEPVRPHNDVAPADNAPARWEP